MAGIEGMMGIGTNRRTFTRRVMPVLRLLAGILAMGGTAPAAAAVTDDRPRIGIGCHMSNPEELDVPAAAGAVDLICADAVAVVQQLAGPGRTVVRIDAMDEALAPPDYPVILVILDVRPDWTGRNPRLLMHATPVRDGRGTATTLLPPAPIDLMRADWADRAHTSLHRMMGFLVR